MRWRLHQRSSERASRRALRRNVSLRCDALPVQPNPGSNSDKPRRAPHPRGCRAGRQEDSLAFYCAGAAGAGAAGAGAAGAGCGDGDAAGGATGALGVAGGAGVCTVTLVSVGGGELVGRANRKITNPMSRTATTAPAITEAALPLPTYTVRRAGSASTFTTVSRLSVILISFTFRPISPCERPSQTGQGKRSLSAGPFQTPNTRTWFRRQPFR